MSEIVGTKMVEDGKTARQIFEEVMANPSRKKFGFGEKLAIVNVDPQQAYTRLDMFDEAGMPALRAKSSRLTGYLRRLIEHHAPEGVEIITPREPEAHGCQLSLLVRHRARERFAALERAGVVCDYREPDVIRVAPMPLYNSYRDAWRFADILSRT